MRSVCGLVMVSCSLQVFQSPLGYLDYSIVYTLQIISYQPYDAAVDWWALGVLTYEMLVGRVSLFCVCYFEILNSSYSTSTCFGLFMYKYVYNKSVGVAPQPPFDGDDDDQLFNHIMEKPVHYPRGMSDPAKKLIQGVGVIKY